MVLAYRSRRHGRHARTIALCGAAIWLGALTAGAISLAVREGAIALLAVPLVALASRSTIKSLSRRCYEIRLSTTGVCEFEAPLQTSRFGVHEIFAIRPALWEINDQRFVDVVVPGGALSVAWPIRDFDVFLDLLQELNPRVKVERRAELARPWIDEEANTREVIRRQPIAAAVVLVICGAIGALLLSQAVNTPVAVLISIPAAIAIWLLLMFGVSKGWVDFEE